MSSRLTFRGPATVSFRGGSPSRESRGSAADRGYDARWTRASKTWRRQHPWCVECEFRGRQVRCDLVDHKIPVIDRPDLMFEPKNLWSLCKNCHDTMKRALEQAAREEWRIGDLIAWCDEPTLRPEGMRFNREDHATRTPAPV